MKQIMEFYIAGDISTDSPGYFGVKDSQVSKIADYANVIEQIRLRVQCERRHDYSVGLNHLLNEIHAICRRIDPKATTSKKYEATQVVEFLRSAKIPHETCIKIRNLFDRRNKNPVSHPDPIAWPVSINEYFDYHKHVGACLTCIL